MTVRRPSTCSGFRAQSRDKIAESRCESGAQSPEGLTGCGKVQFICNTLLESYMRYRYQYNLRMLKRPSGKAAASEEGGGTIRTLCGRSPEEWILAHGKYPPVLPSL